MKLTIEEREKYRKKFTEICSEPNNETFVSEWNRDKVADHWLSVIDTILEEKRERIIKEIIKINIPETHMDTELGELRFREKVLNLPSLNK